MQIAQNCTLLYLFINFVLSIKSENKAILALSSPSIVF